MGPYVSHLPLVMIGIVLTFTFNCIMAPYLFSGVLDFSCIKGFPTFRATFFLEGEGGGGGGFEQPDPLISRMAPLWNSYASNG